MAKLNVRKVVETRLNEEYILQQYRTAVNTERFTDHKDRIQEFKRLYRGDWMQKYPDGTTKLVKPIIENLAKNAVHDISGLANQAKSSVQFIPEKDGQDAYIKARQQEAAADTIWEEGRGRRLERKLYMDMIGSGMAIIALSKSDSSPYAQFTRLDPEFCYPDVRNGAIQDLLFLENVKLRVAARIYGEDKIGPVTPETTDEATIAEYYDDQEVVRAIVTHQTNAKGEQTDNVYIIDRWEHKLKCIPVAFVELESFDGGFRGLLDQVEGPLVARNEIIQYMSDYIESMVHAPFEEKGVLNPEDTPGPFTVYHHDGTANESFMRRVAPAAPAGQVFGLVSYLEQQASGEAVQPPARQGTVQQSIASGSFVNSTLGRLTTVVEELQELMADLRRQATYVAIEIEKKWLDTPKPMIRPVGKKNTYKPSSTFPEYPFCVVQFGAMSGLSKLDADVRVLQHLGAKLTSHKTARGNIDYQWDPTSEQEQIDLEDMMESFKQRMATDPNIPLGIVAKIISAQAAGKTLIEAIQEVAPDLLQTPQQAAPQQGQLPAPEGTPPGQEQTALQAGQVDLSKLFAPPPLQQQIVRNPT